VTPDNTVTVIRFSEIRSLFSEIHA
jgi:hypothetical protein